MCEDISIALEYWQLYAWQCMFGWSAQMFEWKGKMSRIRGRNVTLSNQVTHTRLEGIRGLMKNATLEMVALSKSVKDTCLVGLRFILQIKLADNRVRWKVEWLHRTTVFTRVLPSRQRHQLFNGSHNNSFYPWLPCLSIRVLTFEKSLRHTSIPVPASNMMYTSDRPRKWTFTRTRRCR